MKWYNENRTEMLDLGKVSQFKYSGDDAHLHMDARLHLVVDGIEVWFDGKRATEIYNLLISNKEVI